MATDTIDSPTRPMGLCERYSLTRSLLSSQPAPIILYNLTSESSPPIPAPTLLSAVHTALASLLPPHPVLFTRFTGVHSSAPGLAFLPELDVTRMIVQLGNFQGGGYGVYLDDVLEKLMAEVELVDLSASEGDADGGKVDDVLPPWRVVLCRSSESSKDFHLGLMAHHTLFDGLALLNLTSSLISLVSSALSSPTPDRSPSIPTTLLLPPNPRFPPTLDSLSSLKPRLTTLLPLIYREILLPSLPLPAFIRHYLTPTPQPHAWLGTGSPRAHPRRKRHYTHLIPAVLLTSLLARCKAERTSLTSLLHTLIGRSLARFVPAGDLRPIRGNTALSLRPKDLEGGGTYVGGFSHTLSLSPSSDFTADMWTEARAHHSALRAPGVKKGALETWGLLGFVPSHKTDETKTGWTDFFRPKTEMGTWEASFEVSNLGKAPTLKENEIGSLKLANGGVLFTQPSQAMGPALVVSSLSSASGLALGVSWEEGVFKHDEVQRILFLVEREMRLLVGGNDDHIDELGRELRRRKMEEIGGRVEEGDRREVVGEGWDGRIVEREWDTSEEEEEEEDESQHWQREREREEGGPVASEDRRERERGQRVPFEEWMRRVEEEGWDPEENGDQSQQQRGGHGERR